jgi:DNA-binding CsgD family transcriptional regulator
MSVRSVLVVHAEALVAEGLTAALTAYPELLPHRPALSAGAALAYVGQVDAVAIDANLEGAPRIAARLREGGSRVVMIGGEDRGEEDVVRVSTRAHVSELADALAPGVVTERPIPLTEQQRRILALAARGLTAQQMATRLGLSPKTIEQHKSRIFRKLGVPNQAAAVRAAFVMGLSGGIR